MLPKPEECCFPCCFSRAEHQHHVTYDPEVIKPLCREHHEEITIINGAKARRQRHALSNKQRWFLWYKWQEMEIRPRRTKKALEYIEPWDRKVKPD
jgi:hypothetical protein